MDKIEEILKQYPFIGEDIQQLQQELNRYIELQQEARNPLRSQNIDGMPHGTDVSDQTYATVEKLVDVYQKRIDEIVKQINELMDRKERLDKAFATLTEDERRIIYLRYNERWQTWKIMRRLGIQKDTTYYKWLNSAKEKIKKVMFM